MALILYHVNGDATDNRLENLRIVCPNCNATHEGYLAVGRRFGVSDNAIRKWLRAYGVNPPRPGHGIVPPPTPAPALSDEEANGALASLAAGTSVDAVARSLGVCDKTIRALKHGRTYRHLERPTGLPRAA